MEMEEVLTNSRWRDVEVPRPYHRFLLVEAPDVGLKVFIPLLFRVERLRNVCVRRTVCERRDTTLLLRA